MFQSPLTTLGQLYLSSVTCYNQDSLHIRCY